MSANVAFGDPDLTLQAQPHRHYINGVEVGPRYCDNLTNAGIKKAFIQFHANVHSHLGVTGEIGPLAPGLHNGSGPEITAGGC
jgi:hypothetical protein